MIDALFSAILSPAMEDPTIQSLLEEGKRPLLSYEFFPPKTDKGMENLKREAEILREADPDFVTVTYGAGGSTRMKTFEVCDMLRDMGYRPVMPHLTCVGSSREDLYGIADEIFDRGYRNIMTLRGDPPKGDTEFRPAPDGLSYADELVHLLKERHPEFCCGVAAYPEIHPEALSPEADLENLKRKLSSGGAFATTQLFFDNKVFTEFMAKAKAAGIQHPVIPGLLPALSMSQVERMCGMCGSSLPSELRERLAAAGDDEKASEEAGIEWAARQVDELLKAGAPGIHLYVLNKSHAAMSRPLLDTIAKHR